MRLLIFFLFFVSSASAQEVDSSSYLNMKSVVEFLASDSLMGRAAGSVQEKIAAEYIASRLKQRGYKVKKQKFRFVYDSLKYQSQNVIGFINHHKDSTLFITAHYDHLGMGEYMSLSQSREVHNGADDNASGVAIMLQLAEDLADSIQEYNLLFVSYSGHELGLFGSRFFSKHLCSKYKTIAVALNMDMVGRMDSQSKCYFESKNLNVDALVSKGVNVKWILSVRERLQILDSKWLLDIGVPSITISTGIHLDYHKFTDDIEYMNWDGMERIHQDLKQWLLNTYH
jgi:Iap family predicted aminopeptidase